VNMREKIENMKENIRIFLENMDGYPTSNDMQAKFKGDDVALYAVYEMMATGELFHNPMHNTWMLTYPKDIGTYKIPKAFFKKRGLS